MGEIKGTWIQEETQLDILMTLQSSQEQGVSIRRTCALLQIQHRRVVRWQRRWREKASLAYRKPGPAQAPHRLLSQEIQAIVAMAASPRYGDLSHRALALTAMDQDLFLVSFSTVYRVLKDRDMMSPRGTWGPHNGKSIPPARKVLNGSNQRWCWDISYLMTQQKGVYLYLYLLLDEYSRKVVQWHLDWHQTAGASRELIEGALEAESILDLPEDQRPEILNDRGTQMKAKPIAKLCEDHGMPQLFARPRTPNDNPFIESAFSTIKRAPQYPGRFLDDTEAREYFSRYFTWYNTEHYHSGIDYVTPDQAHRGLREKIVEQRRIKSLAQRRRRWEENQKTKTGEIEKETNQPNTEPLVV